MLVVLKYVILVIHFLLIQFSPIIRSNLTTAIRDIFVAHSKRFLQQPRSLNLVKNIERYGNFKLNS